MTVAQLRFAGFWQRTCAFVLDAAFLLSLTYIAVAVTVSTALEAAVQIFIVCACLLYFIILESSRFQATLGKMVVGIRVTTLVGTRLSIGRAALRFTCTFLSLVTLCIGFLMVAWTKRKQALHDKITSTLVVKQ